jgi:hypothetical protein
MIGDNLAFACNKNLKFCAFLFDKDEYTFEFYMHMKHIYLLPNYLEEIESIKFIEG